MNITRELDNDFMAELLKNAESMDKEVKVERVCNIDDESCDSCGS